MSTNPNFSSETDLGRRQQAEQNLEYSEEIFRVLVDEVDEYAIFALDPSGVIRTWNRGGQRLKGYLPEEVIGTHFRRFYLPADVERRHPEFELEQASKNGKYEEEGWRIKKDGSRFWANVVITALRNPDGTLRGFAKVTRDLTERRRAEEELRLANTNLENRVEERTRELAAAMERAEEAVRARDEFFSLASHELKTPLTSLLMQSEMRVRNLKKGRVADYALEKLPEKFAYDVMLVRRLSNLVDRMLDISRISSGSFELKPEPFDLAEMARDVVARMAPILQETGNVIELSAPSPVRGEWDRLSLEQVFTNLLTNAGRYAAGKPVEVSVTLDQETALITVRDHGQGISAESQGRIFEPFKRAENYSQAGLGLGLYVVKKISELHRGSVQIESVAGEGATFRIRIPLA